jgi:phytoene dehydrogenase-like protein
MKKKMIIVGAGISGLSTGYYAQMNGFDTEIFEMHNIPGGLFTAWTRKGYTFDTSMHFLMSSKKGPFKKLWDELGITKDQEFHYHDRTAFIEGEGKRLDICMNRQKLEEQMLAISLADSELIKEFIDFYFGESPLSGMSLDPLEVKGIFSKIKMISAMLSMFKKFKKYSKLSIQDFASRFKDKFLSKAMRYQIDSPGWPMPNFPFILLAGGAKSTVDDSGYPLGGSKKVVFGMAKRFEELGGKIHYKTRVKDVIIENNKAVGIQLEDVSVNKADIVVWCADGHHLIFDILKEKYVNNKIKKMYQNWIPVKPLMHVMFGVNMDLSKEPHCMILEIKNPIKVGHKEFKWIHIMSHCFDKSTAPAGKSAIEVWYATDYGYWEDLIKDREKYDMEKKRIADETAEALDARWPGFKSKIEMTDVPTPMTYVRYTGNWLGSPDGWYITVDNFIDQSMRRTLPGLKNLYMVGQWTAPYTGTVSTSLGGRQLVQILCKKNRMPFKSAVE